MTTTRSAALLHNHDEIPLPLAVDDVVEGSASRHDRYPIVVTRSLEEAASRVAEMVGDRGVGLISDDRVYELHGRTFLQELRELGLRPSVFTIRAGEANKSLDEAVRAWNWLADGSLGRRDVILNLGGGVVIDLGGWVASGYMRGMGYLNVPTTLVGQVDAGIGGKLAVNHPRAKNLIGGFHQPFGVVSCVGYLGTLELRAVRAGLAETIKKALIASPPYLDFIEGAADRLLARDPEALCELVSAAGAIKAELIARDPYEVDSRRTLGFGHALAHPLETVTGFGPIVHGEAVAFGMVVEARMALARGMLAESTFDRILALLARCGLPTSADSLPVAVDGRALLDATEKVRLARGGFLRWVLPLDVGETAIVDSVSDEEIRAALHQTGIEC
jgi:3-dehydroquinate synthase